MSLQIALQKLGFRQRAYQSAFGEGSPGHMVMVDLALYCKAFKTDDVQEPNTLMRMQGRRDVFFRIFDHLKLTPNELEAVYRTAVQRAAARLQTNQGEYE